MLSVTRADGSAERQTLELLRSRSGEVDRKVATVVTQIIETVRQEGDAALRRYAEQFDSAAPARLEVTKEEIEQALDTADADFVQALRRAKENITAFHARQKQQSFWDAQPNGVILGQRVRGLHRVGLYVPGGTAAYPSSVLMNAIPAKIAGVEELIMVTPPNKNGGANPDILAAAAIAGWTGSFDRRRPGGGGAGLRNPNHSAGGQNRRPRKHLCGNRQKAFVRTGGY